jgi:dCMP deaminase
MDRASRDFVLLATALIWAKRSTCKRRKVGAVLAVDGRIVSTGYNEAPSGFPDCSDGVCDFSQPCTRTVHAEANAIAFAARMGLATEGSTLYTVATPCLNCAKLIVNAGIKRVVYHERYRVLDGEDLLAHAGVHLCFFDMASEIHLLEGGSEIQL